jgi:hypothetical protein
MKWRNGGNNRISRRAGEMAASAKKENESGNEMAGGRHGAKYRQKLLGVARQSRRC